MKKAYVIFAMKRSGHHAIVHWIGYNQPCAMHFNDYKIHGKDFIPAHITKPVIFGNPKNEPDIHIYNMEDFNPVLLPKLRKLPVWGDYDEVQYIMVLRDPFNWIASCLKCGGGMAKRLKRRIELYKAQANLFKTENDILCVNYNKWVKSEIYRIGLAKYLDLPTCDEGVEKLSERGGGSSFDKKKFKNNASKMDVFGRWKHFKTDPAFTAAIDMQLCKISADIFEFNPGLKKGVKNG